MGLATTPTRVTGAVYDLHIISVIHRNAVLKRFQERASATDMQYSIVHHAQQDTASLRAMDELRKPPKPVPNRYCRSR